MNKGKVDCVLGLCFGDEGKGKIVDYLSQDYYKKWINLRKEVRELVRTQNISITPEFAKLIGLK